MPKSNQNRSGFPGKIALYCDQRLGPNLPKREYENLRSYMLGLVKRRAPPPRKGAKLDWHEISVACDLHGENLQTAKRLAQHGFEAIIRWHEGDLDGR